MLLEEDSTGLIDHCSYIYGYIIHINVITYFENVSNFFDCFMHEKFTNKERKQVAECA